MPKPDDAEFVRKHVTAAVLAVFCLWTLTGCGPKGQALPPVAVAPAPTDGPLRIVNEGARYFVDAHGRPVYLTGSHTWNTVQDWGASNPPPMRDYVGFLDQLRGHSHNFTRLFVWEQAAWVPWTREKVWFTPMPYQRTGPGDALDGGARFDLTKFDPTFLARLRERVLLARDRGIYASVMLFDGWSTSSKTEGINERLRRNGLGNPWVGHPFNLANNINGIDGDPDHTGEGLAIHTLRLSAVTELQRAYLARVVDTLNDLDNVLWEVCNECDRGSEQWEYEVIRFVHAYEKGKPYQHPVGMTALYPDSTNSALFSSPAEWVAPLNSPQNPYEENPPADLAAKIVISDTDHLWGIGGDQDWVWKTVCRGLNPIFMDPMDANLIGNYPMYRSTPTPPNKDEQFRRTAADRVRRNLGYARHYADQMDLSRAAPHSELASSNFCLAVPGKQYLVYLPRQSYGIRGILSGIARGHLNENVDLDLSRESGTFQVEWFRPSAGLRFASEAVSGGGVRKLGAPFRGDAVLFVTRSEQGPVH